MLSPHPRQSAAPDLASPTGPGALDAAVRAHESTIRELRRYLHAHPEPSGAEFRTTSYLQHLAEDAGMQFRVAPSGRGLIVDGGPVDARQRIAIRADIDALRIQDEKSVIYHSQEANLMHACGHDAHTAMAWGATLALHEMRKKAPSLAWRAIFQPSEETAQGANEMIDAGALDDVVATYALHVDPAMPSGVLGFRSGTLTAACDEFNVLVKGRGGHGARPHLAADPIFAATQYVNAVYSHLPRSVDSRHASVVSVGMIEAGVNPNVIPETAVIRGTIRTVEPGGSEAIRQRLRMLASAVGETHGCEIVVDFPYHLPSVRNAPDLTARAQTTAIGLFGEARVVDIPLPSLGGEDFAFYLTQVPGVMARLGVAFPGESARHLHTNTFDVHEDALIVGARWLAAMAGQGAKPR